MSFDAVLSRLVVLGLAATFTFGCVGGSKSSKKKSEDIVATDTGPPNDATAPPEDSGTPPEDSGISPKEVVDSPADVDDTPDDATTAPEDGVVPPQDATPPEDATTPPEDVAVPPEDVASPEDASLVPAGACTNEADQAILDSKDIEGISKDCAIQNFGNAPAMTKCIQDATGLSDGCVVCFGEINSCGMSQCLVACIFPDEDACDECIAEKCAPAFDECSGLDASGG